MIPSQLTDQIEDSFLEDCTNSWLDAADRHCIPHHLAEVMLLDEILRDFHLADPVALRAYVIATLDALDAKRPHGPESLHYTEACGRREVHGPALLAAMSKMIEAEDFAPIVLPGGAGPTGKLN